ncbi:MAG: hypothetical protein ACK535_03795 [Cyanobacteriota bacterium]
MANTAVFLFLAVEAGHPVSPSRPVDLAWHQHLLDTRRYWQEFCPRGWAGRWTTPHRGGARSSGSVCGSGTAARWQAIGPASARARLRISGLRRINPSAVDVPTPTRAPE